MKNLYAAIAAAIVVWIAIGTFPNVFSNKERPLNEIKKALEREGLVVKYTDDVEALPYHTTFALNGNTRLTIEILASQKDAEQFSKSIFDKFKIYTEEEKKRYDEEHILVKNVLFRYFPSENPDEEVLRKIKNAASWLKENSHLIKR